MNNAERVISRFGGQSHLANLLGKAPSTVQYWAQRGEIPAKYRAQLLELAKEQAIELYPGDFVSDIVTTEDTVSLPVAKWEGVLEIGQSQLPVFVLDNGDRVISRGGATRVLTSGKGGGNLEQYVNVEALKEYIPPNWSDQLTEFAIPQVVNRTVLGMTADMFLEICRAYVKALDEGNLKTPRQMEIATKAALFLAACSKVGLIALIDEATGYQYVRAEDALQFKLRLFLEDEMRKWEPTFPEELWIEFARLTNWKGANSQRPKYWGRLIMELIYGYLDADVAEWLRKNNPRPRKGQNHHQWLSGQYGLKKLTEHLWMVIGLAKACRTMRELQTKMAEIYGRQPVQEYLFLPPPISAAKSSQLTQKKSPGNESATKQPPLGL